MHVNKHVSSKIGAGDRRGRISSVLWDWSHYTDEIAPHGGDLRLWGFDLRFGRQVYNIILEVI